MDYDTAVRVINVTLALVCLTGLGYKMAKHWSKYQSRTKDFWWVLTAWSLAVFLGSIEVLLEWSTDFRVFFTLFALALTARVIFQKNEVEKPTMTKEF